MIDAFFDQYASRYGYAKPGGVWCYEDGCVYRGLLELSGSTGDRRWRDHLDRLIAEQIDENGNLRGYSPTEFNIDNILAGRALFGLTENKGDRFDRALDLLASQLADHPRAPSGNYWHKKVYPNQVWLDGLYMGLPFQIEYGLLRDLDALVDDATGQLLRAVAAMIDAASGLYFHGQDQLKIEKWADPQTGLSASFWARANGWLAMALVDAYVLLPEGHADRDAIGARAVALFEALLRQRTPNGLWLQVLDRPDLDGNYEETSSSAMFAYAFMRAARHIAGQEHLADEGLAALAAIERHYVRQNEGVWQLENICEVAGLGGMFGKQRDGSAGYYVSEPVVANDPKGVGPLMMAVAERELIETTAPAALGDVAATR